MQMKWVNRLYTTIRNMRQRDNDYCFNTTAEKFGAPINLLAFKVTSIRNISDAEMYDIEVERAHTYISNGIISHNTISMLNGTTKNDIEEAFVYAWKKKVKGMTIYRDGSRNVQVLDDVTEEDIQKASCATGSCDI